MSNRRAAAVTIPPPRATRSLPVRRNRTSQTRSIWPSSPTPQTSATSWADWASSNTAPASGRSPSLGVAVRGAGYPRPRAKSCARLPSRARRHPRGAGLLPVQGRPRTSRVRGQGQIAAPTTGQLLPGLAQHRPADARDARGRPVGRVDRRRLRGRGAPPRVHADPAPPSALQRALPRRQVVPVPGAHHLRGGAAGPGAARQGREGRPAVRPVRPRVRDPRDPGPAAAHLPGAHVLAGHLRPGRPDGQAVPAVPHRPLRRTVRRQGLARRAPRTRRPARAVPRRRDRARSCSSSKTTCMPRRRAELRGGGPATATSSRPSARRSRSSRSCRRGRGLRRDRGRTRTNSRPPCRPSSYGGAARRAQGLDRRQGRAADDRAAVDLVRLAVVCGPRRRHPAPDPRSGRARGRRGARDPARRATTQHPGGLPRAAHPAGPLPGAAARRQGARSSRR